MCIILLNDFYGIGKISGAFGGNFFKTGNNTYTCRTFRESDASEIDKVSYLILSGLAPGYKGIVFNIAEKMMVNVLAMAYGIDKDSVRGMYKTEGDLGSLADKLAQKTINKKQKTNFSVEEVYEGLYKIAIDGGEECGEEDRKNGGASL